MSKITLAIFVLFVVFMESPAWVRLWEKYHPDISHCPQSGDMRPLTGHVEGTTIYFDGCPLSYHFDAAK